MLQYCHSWFQSGRAQYEKSQQNKKDEKDKSRNDREIERSEKNHWRNKINLVIIKNSGFEVIIYYHIIYKS